MSEKFLSRVSMPSLFTREYHSITQINGPLLFVDRIDGVAYDEMVEIIDPDDNVRLGRFL